MAVLTDARLSLWSAIDNYADLEDVFNQKYKFDQEQALLEEIEPSLSDLPAIAIVPANMAPEWFANRMQHWPYLLDVTIWTPNWIFAPAEDLVEKVMLSFYRAKPEASSVTYVMAATGFHPWKNGPVTFNANRLKDAAEDQEGTKVMLTRQQIGLRIHKDPFGDDA